MLNRILTLESFVDLVIHRIEKLTLHSFIAREQANYLNQLKQDLPGDKVIVLGDFVENYQFILQDEVQEFYWNSSQCTLHSIVIYYKVNNSIQSHSLCFTSNDLTHDVDMVYEVIKHTIDFAKIFLPFDINKVHYFSDGCAGQYKNCKNMLNQTYHFKDFGITVTWSFFATSHRKSPCHGIGGTIKRLTARESLQ